LIVHHDWGHALGSDVAFARASKLAERMKAQTRDGASFDPEAAGWASTTPCYGSQAYDADWRAYEGAEMDAV
jgi:hypothetical protein